MSTPNESTSTFRTDRNNNPTAFTTDMAKEAGLILGSDYEIGDSFKASPTLTLYTAKLLGDPIALTIKVIDKLGFYTGNGPDPTKQWGGQRWEYCGWLFGYWNLFSTQQKIQQIGLMYTAEGGTAMKDLFS
jgi:hypothetical protein